MKTLKEQQDLWPKIRRVLLSRPLHWSVVSTEWFAWKAAGVPPAQRRMIISDHQEQGDLELRGEAVWQYIVDTLDPVIKNTLISDDNYFYLLCLQGHYTQRYLDLKQLTLIQQLKRLQVSSTVLVRGRIPQILAAKSVRWITHTHGRTSGGYCPIPAGKPKPCNCKWPANRQIQFRIIEY